MKPTSILLLVLVLLEVSAPAFSQRISLSGRRLSLEKVFNKVKAQTGYLFLYNPATLKMASPVTLDLKDVPLEEALDLCVKGQPLTYKIVNRTILIAKKEGLFPIAEKEEIPRIKGLVRDSVTSQPLIGVSVQLQTIRNGKRITRGGTLTDEQGAFSLRLPEEKAFFVFSHTGFEGLTVPTKDLLDNHLVRLKPAAGSLQEVIVNKGYYSTTRELNTGDVSTVTARTIGQQPVSDPLLALQGRVAGLLITRQSGISGAAVTVQMRGPNSIASGNDPFYIVDGVPYISALLRTTDNQIISSITTGGSPFSFLNPADIESITVLKDADALAIYGAQGANGAILITTKKGKAGDTKVELNIAQGTGKNPRKVSLLNTQQYLMMRYEALKNDGDSPGPDDYDLLDFDPHRYTDWQKALTGETAAYTNAQASVSGGARNTTFLVSGNFFRQGSVFPGDFKDQKEAFHFSITHTNGKFKALLTGSYLADDNKLPGTDPMSDALTLPPNAPSLVLPDGSLNWDEDLPYNPAGYMKQPYENNTRNLILNAVLSYQILPGLQLKTNLGLTSLRSQQIVLTPIASLQPFGAQPQTGSSSFVNNSVKGWIIEPGLHYSRPWGNGRLSALIGATLRQNLTDGTALAAVGYTDDRQLRDPRAAALTYPSSLIYAQYRYEALYGQLNYNFRDKYIINLTGRRDGSSRFGPGRQFADFGAAGAAWIFSNERIVQDRLPFLSFGKLRGSYGTTGNDQIGDYGFLSPYSPNFYTYLQNRGLTSTNLANPDYAWELNRKLEGGLELGFWKDRLRLSASVYRNRSGNQLVSQPLTSVTGFTSVTANLPAVVQNTGLELEANTINIKESVFQWTSSVNLTVPRNKLVSYPGLAASVYADSYVIGQPLNILKLYNYRGVNPVTGLYQFLDAAGKLTSSPAYITDATAFKCVGPQFYGGFSNAITWKRCSLDFLFMFVKQTAVDFPYLAFYSSPGNPENAATGVLARWQHSGDVTSVQKFSRSAEASDAYYGAQYGTNSIVDASYARLKNCSFSYSFPATVNKKMHIRNCRLYLQGQDLFTITRYKGLDPETLTTSLPPLRVITAGGQLTF